MVYGSSQKALENEGCRSDIRWTLGCRNVVIKDLGKGYAIHEQVAGRTCRLVGAAEMIRFSLPKQEFGDERCICGCERIYGDLCDSMGIYARLMEMNAVHKETDDCGLVGGRWVEVEARAGKRAGSAFPDTTPSR